MCELVQIERGSHIFFISDQISVAMVNIQDLLAMGFEEWLLNATDSSIDSICF